MGIIVGCNYAEMVQTVNQHAPCLPVKRMVQNPSHYRLTIEGKPGASPDPVPFVG